MPGLGRQVRLAQPSCAPIWAGVTNPIAQFELLSDAAQVATLGGMLWVFAGFAAVMERRRAKMRSMARLEQVGWVPWTTLFMLAAMLGGGCLAMSLPVVIGGM